jgi:hypothetical protein
MGIDLHYRAPVKQKNTKRFNRVKISQGTAGQLRFKVNGLAIFSEQIWANLAFAWIK